MIKKKLTLCILIICSSCFNNKIKEIKDLSFEKLKINKNASQVNSKYIEGIEPKEFENFLLNNNFKKISDKKNETNLFNEYIFNEPDANYKIIVDGEDKLNKIEFFSSSKTNSLEKANLFFNKAAKIPIPQVDTIRTKSWTQTNINLVNENFSKATILSNIHFILEQINSNEFKLTIKKYGI